MTDLSTIDFAAAAPIIKRLAEVAEALILSHADAVGLTCTAVEVAPRVYHAAKARFAKPAEHRRSATKPKTHRKATAVPVCPPSGIATIGALPNMSRPLVRRWLSARLSAFSSNVRGMPLRGPGAAADHRQNFRKFCSPVTIDGLADGLNIVVEPNKTGDST
ncbi:hypothetical protein ABIC16_004181 [Sphingomonas sp. PvP055]|uniref:hypothetical protein n=1 Tax=Sphingomonas sp. PvP055 TaxID=3156391 RepID=UPI0033971539